MCIFCTVTLLGVSFYHAKEKNHRTAGRTSPNSFTNSTLISRTKIFTIFVLQERYKGPADFPGEVQQFFNKNKIYQGKPPINKSETLKRNQILALFAASSFFIAEIMRCWLRSNKLSWRRIKSKLVVYISNLQGSNNVKYIFLGKGMKKMLGIAEPS